MRQGTVTGGATADAVVAEGRNGRLFLNRQESFDLGRFVEGRLLSPLAIARWRLTLRRRAAALAALGIPYVFYIVPDAPSVHPEDLPAGIAPAGPPLGARLAACLEGIANLHVVYPLAELVAAKGGLPLYRRTDTHWSGYGAFVAYQALCRALGAFIPVTAIPARDMRFVMQHEFGDLGSLTTPERRGLNATMRMEGHGFSRGPVRPGPFRTNSQVFHAEGTSDVRLLVLRDSFMTEQAPLLAATFGTTEMVGTTSRLFPEHVRRMRPDVVVSEICERRLTEWENDHQLLGYDEMFGTDWTTDTGRVALSAEMALGRGETAAAVAAVGQLMAHDAGLAHGHAFVAARVCLAAGDLEEAARLIGTALAAQPGRTAYLCVAGQVCLARGDGIRALALAREARESAPWNGYVHELLGYVLLALDRAEEALAVFDAAERGIDDHPNLFMLASMAAERCRRGADAVARMERCLALWPDNPAYRDRLAQLRGCGAKPS